MVPQVLVYQRCTNCFCAIRLQTKKLFQKPGFATVNGTDICIACTGQKPKLNIYIATGLLLQERIVQL